jgi:hypothetical protein
MATQENPAGERQHRRVYFVIGDFGRLRTDDIGSTKNLYGRPVRMRELVEQGKVAIPELARIAARFQAAALAAIGQYETIP